MRLSHASSVTAPAIFVPILQGDKIADRVILADGAAEKTFSFNLFWKDLGENRWNRGKA